MFDFKLYVIVRQIEDVNKTITEGQIRCHQARI